jgi:hypothetical protein
MTRLWSWLHRHDIHLLCRSKRLPNYRELIVGTDGDVIDVTNQAAVGRLVHIFRGRSA